MAAIRRSGPKGTLSDKMRAIESGQASNEADGDSGRPMASAARRLAARRPRRATRPTKGSWLYVAAAVAIVVTMATFGYIDQSSVVASGEDPRATRKPPPSSIPVPEVVVQDLEVVVENLRIIPGEITLHGHVSNLGSRGLRRVNLVAELRTGGGKILGNAYGVVRDLPQGKSAPFLVRGGFRLTRDQKKSLKWTVLPRDPIWQ